MGFPIYGFDFAMRDVLGKIRVPLGAVWFESVDIYVLNRRPRESFGVCPFGDMLAMTIQTINSARQYLKKCSLSGRLYRWPHECFNSKSI